MRFCEVCNSKFSFSDRLKSISKKYGAITCSNCNTVYRQKPGIYQSIFNGLIFFIYFYNIEFLKSLTRFTDNIFIEAIIMGILVSVSILVFDLIPHRWQKYEKYE
jgi:CXXC-20-CXXC protein